MGRTYLRTGVDAAGLTDDAFVTAMRAHSTIVTTGPFIELSVGDGATSARPGDTLAATSTSLTVSIRVLAPSWIEVESVSLYGSEACPDAGGACTPLMTWPASPGAPGVWLEEIDVPVAVSGDTWLYVRADGSRDMAPAYPGHRPFAHTAAVLVDVP